MLDLTHSPESLLHARSKAPDSKRVTICHATGSPKQPYIMIEVAIQAAAMHLAKHDDVYLSQPYYQDKDNDGYGVDPASGYTCGKIPQGYSDNNLDCDDDNWYYNPERSCDR